MPLPEQLKQDIFGFVKLQGKTKIPFEAAWQLRPHKWQEIEQWLESGSNYGIIGGFGNLIIIDCDTPELEKHLIESLPPTFRVKTSKGAHFYFICPGFHKKLVLKKDNLHHGELISTACQCVGPGSIHPETQAAYFVDNDVPIAVVTQQDIITALTDYLPHYSSQETPADHNVVDILRKKGIELRKVGDQLYAPHPIHGSTTGMNFCVNEDKNVWHCFRCGSGGGPYELIGVLEQIILCEDAKPGSLRGDLFLAVKRAAQERYDYFIEAAQTPPKILPPGHWNDEWNAGRFIEDHKDIVRNCDNLGGWHIWDGKCWEKDDTYKALCLARQTIMRLGVDSAGIHDPEIRKKFSAHLKTSGNNGKHNAMLDIAKSYPGISVKSEEFDKDPYLLNCENGVLELRTCALRPHNSGFLMSKKVNAPFDENAKAPNWEEFLSVIFKENDELIEYVQKVFGYSLTADTSKQLFFILWGNGANGKSTLVETFYKLLGGYATLATDTMLLAKHFESHPTDIASLKGARFVLCSEIEQARALDAAVIKRFTSQEPIKSRFMHKDFFSFTPEGKLFLQTNYKPIVRGTDEGIWRRIRLIPFEHRFTGANRIDNYARDYLFPEFPGILRWAVEGYQKMIQDGLKSPEIVQFSTKSYRDREDAIAGFLDDFCELGELFRVGVVELFDAFKQTSDGKIRRKDFIDYMESNGYPKLQGCFGGMKGKYYFSGLRLIETHEEPIDDYHNTW